MPRAGPARPGRRRAGDRPARHRHLPGRPVRRVLRGPGRVPADRDALRAAAQDPAADARAAGRPRPAGLRRAAARAQRGEHAAPPGEPGEQTGVSAQPAAHVPADRGRRRRNPGRRAGDQPARGRRAAARRRPARPHQRRGDPARRAQDQAERDERGDALGAGSRVRAADHLRRRGPAGHRPAAAGRGHVPPGPGQDRLPPGRTGVLERRHQLDHRAVLDQLQDPLPALPARPGRARPADTARRDVQPLQGRRAAGRGAARRAGLGRAQPDRGRRPRGPADGLRLPDRPAQLGHLRGGAGQQPGGGQAATPLEGRLPADRPGLHPEPAERDPPNRPGPLARLQPADARHPALVPDQPGLLRADPGLLPDRLEPDRAAVPDDRLLPGLRAARARQLHPGLRTGDDLPGGVGEHPGQTRAAAVHDPRARDVAVDEPLDVHRHLRTADRQARLAQDAARARTGRGRTGRRAVRTATVLSRRTDDRTARRTGRPQGGMAW